MNKIPYIPSLLHQCTSLSDLLTFVVDQPEQSNPEMLIDLFESSLPDNTLNRSGSFYTPHTIANQMLVQAISNFSNITTLESICSLKILDPSCGGGTFLVHSLRKLISILKEYNLDSFENRILTAESCIYGIDLNSQAAFITKAALALTLLEGISNNNTRLINNTFLNNNIYCANSLIDSNDLKSDNVHDLSLSNEIKSLSWNEVFYNILNRENPGFDLIIGNPPYGLSRGEKISYHENQKLKEIFKDYKLGKINKYMAFMVQGIKYLRKDGILSLLVPNSWLGISSATRLREILLKEGALKCIQLYGSDAFPKLGVETLSFIWQKEASTKHINIAKYKAVSTTNETTSLPIDFCLNLRGFSIPVNWNENISALAKIINEKCFCMGDIISPFVPMIALQAYAVGKGNPPQTDSDVAAHVYHSRIRHSNEYHKYLEGKDVRRYAINWSGRYLKWGPWLAEPQTIERFACPRILISEVTNPEPYLLSACYTEEMYFYNKSVLHIFLKINLSRDLLWALLAILNSSLASKLISFYGKKSQRKLFPKILNGDLKYFPIPHSIFDNFKELATFSRRIATLSENSISKLEIDNLQKKIDEYIVSLYQLENFKFVNNDKAA